MSLFQILIVIAAVVLVAKAGMRLTRRKISWWLFLAWLFFWAVIVVVGIFPAIINRLADRVGVGRGVDLMIYLALGVIVYILFKQQARLGKQEKDLAKMVQAKAVDDALESATREKASDKKI